jgi:hypothetical protein
MKVKSTLDASPSYLREFEPGVGPGDELKRRAWGFVLPRCLAA